jgi:hypothetical protein
MAFIITSIHDPSALAATCRQCNIPAPKEGNIQLGGQAVSGWVMHLPGVQFPIVCNTLTGLVAYHPRDNAFLPYRSVMRFIHRYYAVRHAMSQGEELSGSGRPVYRYPRRPTPTRRYVTADAV